MDQASDHRRPKASSAQRHACYPLRSCAGVCLGGGSVLRLCVGAWRVGASISLLLSSFSLLLWEPDSRRMWLCVNCSRGCGVREGLVLWPARVCILLCVFLEARLRCSAPPAVGCGWLLSPRCVGESSFSKIRGTLLLWLLGKLGSLQTPTNQNRMLFLVTHFFGSRRVLRIPFSGL